MNRVLTRKGDTVTDYRAIAKWVAQRVVIATSGAAGAGQSALTDRLNPKGTRAKPRGPRPRSLTSRGSNREASQWYRSNSQPSRPCK